MKIETKIVTPEIAVQFLEKNNNVRTPDLRKITRIANSIKRGEWVTTHQGIAFDSAGYLVDGQNRLMAIIEADRAIELMVATEVSQGAVAEMDRNTPRSNAVLLGTTTKCAEIVTYISRILYGGAPTRCNLQDVKDILDVAIVKLYQQTLTTKRSLSTAPVKSAFVTAYLMQPDEYIFEIYRKLILLNVCNIEELSQTPAAIRALYQRLTGIKEENKRIINSYQAFSYTLHALKNPSLKKIHMVDIDQTIKTVRHFYRNTFSL